MNQNLKNSIILTIGIFLLSGCAGYDRVLFITKTNVGLDIDDTPPTAEITIARRELAITPTYQDTLGEEKTLPLLGAFGLTGGTFDPGISSVFAGGDAAVLLATEKNEDIKKWDSSLCLAQPPDARGPLKRFWHWITNADYEKIDARTRAFYFSTDTSFGLKVGWNGTGGPYPTSLKLGYSRIELASPPIFIKKGCASGRGGNDNVWEVKVPSFFASLDNKSNFFSEPADPELGVRGGPAVTGGVTHVQFFATGMVAKAWAARSSIKKETFKRMAPKAAKLEQ